MCVCVCDTERVCWRQPPVCPGWRSPHGAIYTKHTPPHWTHTHVSVFVSLSLCVFSCSSTFFYTLPLSLFLSLFTSLFISFLSPSLCVGMFVCTFRPLCLCPVVHCFQKVKLCLTGSRWQAGLCVCVCTRNHCYQCYLPEDRWELKAHTHLPAVVTVNLLSASSSSFSLLSSSCFVFLLSATDFYGHWLLD